MMYVPIYNKHALTEIYSVLRGNCDIIKEAETLNEVWVCMMPWWSNYAVASVKSIIKHALDSRQARLARKLGSGESIRALVIVFI